jgi:RNA polymerase sigma factor (sigma-70 family)
MSDRLSQAIRQLRDAALLRDEERLRDGELLGAFVTARDAAAFEELLRRHGPMVLGVCRRVLRDAHDAEDAFQAAFLVLARRAASVVPREAVGNWLYGVACRTALEARRMIARRRAREKQAAAAPRPTDSEPCPPDLHDLLDHELSRLPDKLRLPVVLCDLEGRTRREVARQLGVPDGTLSNRLTAARRTLAKRLADRGVTLPAGALAIALAGSAVPALLAASTLRAALATGPAAAAAVSAAVSTLTQGVLKTMFLAKLKTIAAVALALGVVTGVGLWCARPATATPAESIRKPVAVVAAEEEKKGVEKRAILEQAVTAAKAIPATKDEDLHRKVHLLVTIAYDQGRYGDKTAAAATYKLAFTVAGSIKDEDLRIQAHGHVGFYQANAGLIADARKTLEAMTFKDKKKEPLAQSHRNQVLLEMVSHLAKEGDFKEALKLAESIPVSVTRFKPKDAEKEVEHRDSMMKDTAYQRIAEAQIKADDVTGALKTLAAIKTSHLKLYPRQSALIALAKTDPKAAAKLLEEWRKELEADNPFATARKRYMFLASTQAGIGDVDGAMAWIKKLDSEEDRVNALLGVSLGISLRAHVQEPKEKK